MHNAPPQKMQTIPQRFLYLLCGVFSQLSMVQKFCKAIILCKFCANPMGLLPEVSLHHHPAGKKILVFVGNTVLMLAASSTSRNALMIVECGCLEFQRIWSASAGTVTGDCCLCLGRSQNRRTFEEIWQ